MHTKLALSSILFFSALLSFVAVPQSAVAAPGTWQVTETGGPMELSVYNSSYIQKCSGWSMQGVACDTSENYCVAGGATAPCPWGDGSLTCIAVDSYACVQNSPPPGCSYSGTLSWAPGCSVSGSWSASSGSSLSAENTASGYQGSISYSCNNGTWAFAGSSCELVDPPRVYGCKDSNATNYGGPSVTHDDGSCTYTVYGCTDPSANNYNPSANTNNGSCTYNPVGCTYNGTLSWGSGCSVSDSWSAPHGGSASANNTASGYTGSATYSCSNGSWTLSSQSCSPIVSDCTSPWGTPVAHGSSVTAYQSSSVPYGSSCNSQQRACSNGSLSGSYQYQSCSVESPGSCSLPWGGSTAHGTSVTAYQSSSVPYGSSCNSQQRACSNGSLSGSYQYQSCTVGSAPPTASLSASSPVTSGGRSTLTWSSTNATSCTAGSSPWSATLGGSGLSDPLTSNTTFTYQCTGPGGTSALQSATVTVTSAPVTTCSLPWGGTINDSQSVTAYQTSSVTSPTTCASVAQTRTCSNGTLSGSYTNQSCTSSAPPTPAPTVSINLATSAVQGASVPMTYSSTNATSCSSAAPLGISATSGSFADISGILSPGNNNLQITCSGPGGSDTETASIYISVPSVDISANPTRVRSGNSSTISWSSSDVSSCSVSGPNLSSNALSGSQSISIAVQSLFSITCDGVSDSVTVNIIPIFNEF